MQRFLPGVYQVPEITLGLPANRVWLSVLRSNWPQGLCAKLDLEGSLDEGETWQKWGGLTAPGGEVLGKDGAVSPETFYQLEFSDEQNQTIPIPVGTKIRGVVEFFQELDSEIELGTD